MDHTERRHRWIIQREDTDGSYREKTQMDHTERRHRWIIQREDTDGSYREKIQMDHTERRHRWIIQRGDTDGSYSEKTQMRKYWHFNQRLAGHIQKYIVVINNVLLY